jgi:hypothetical protein
MSDEVAELLANVEALALPAHFTRIDPQPTPSGAQLPHDAAVWRSAFALLAVCRVPDATRGALEEIRDITKRWVGETLRVEQQRGRLMDGYLILALYSPPEDADQSLVQRIATSTDVCRKYVIWPHHDGSWDRQLSRVTTLGLPPLQPVVPTSGEIDLPRVAERALESVNAHKSVDDTLESLTALVQES